ncbi:hypothetical protein QZH41_017262 [Actinostola sp. cb2023]|nr:hypothetical protein QZH41_017262 [Actinostola sp. cb2023]
MDKRDVIICSASALTASTVAVLLYRYFSQRRKNVYETDKLVNEYLIFHFGKPREVLSYNFGPVDALDFPLRCAEVCIQNAEKDIPSFALDVGCAVGRSTFELARHFKHVVGIDYSQAFVDTCTTLKMYGKLHYRVTTEGCLYSEHDALVDDDISLWLGGYKDSEGNPVTGFDTLKNYLKPHFDLLEAKDMPFFIRETARKNQWSVAQLSVWRRRKVIN